jgi:DNA-directed RNA polymerase specialized sigma24 family protein
MKKDWELTEEAFNKFLAWLHPDRDRAAEIYESLRERLVTLFAARRCPDAEDLADETINRVIKRAQEMANSYRGSPIPYFITVANHLYLESVANRSTHTDLPVDLPDRSNPSPQDERDHECLAECLERLTPSNRSLVLEYYSEDRQAKIDHRKKLADKRGIAVNALRIRTHRIRVELQKCMNECLERNEAAETD